ncbi:MAG: FAD-dependent oxidoreductase [Candidatus Thermoplasmatota archaeon]
MTRLVVVGGNGAGMTAASKAKRRNPDLEVTVFEAGPHISYSSCGIPHLIEGTVEEPEKLLVLDDAGVKERGIEVLTGTKAVGVNPYTKEITVEGPRGRDASHYDKLCIATGTEAANPFKGGDLAGVFTLRHLTDGVRLMEHIDSARSKSIGIVGAGYLGLEMAEAFHKRGSEVHLITKGRVMPQFDADITDGLEPFLEERGIHVHSGTEVTALAPGKRQGQVGVIETKGKGKDVQVDTALVAVGVRPHTAFATKAGIHALSSGHLLVDDQMRTNLHDVWAAGDCVAPRHLITGRPTGVALALPANRMGRVAGDNIAASTERIPGPSLYFPGVLGTAITRIFGLAFAQTGLNEEQARKEGFDVATTLVESRNKAPYMPDAQDMAIKMVADRDSGKLLGVELAGPAESALRINAAAVAIQAGLTVKKLAEVETAYAPPFSLVWDPMLTAASQLAKDVRK